MPKSIAPLFHPGSVAVIGASRRRGTVGAEIFHNLVAQEMAGPVYPVNPGSEFVQAVRAYARVKDVPGPVDLAVIVVPKEQVLGVAEECIAKGVKGLVVISAGFAETGAEGRARQDKLLATVRAAGVRMIGPNCLGVLNTDPTVRLNATFAPTWPPAGNVAFSSQSGAIGLAILDYAKELGIGISHFASVGNKADVSGNDLIEYWEQDPRTEVILLYLESFGNPQRFMATAKRVARHKPIAVVKSGRTAAGARAASSHTGALAGLDVAVDALLGQAGVIRTDTIEELFDIAMVLSTQPVPRGHRVAILTNAGGPGIMAADACEARGLMLPSLSRKTEDALRAFLPAEASVANPVDMIASASADAFGKAIPLLLADPNVDALMVLFVPPVVTAAHDVAEAIRRGAQGTPKTVLTCFMGTHGVPEALSSLREGRFPSYAFPEAAALALSRAARYGDWLQRPAGTVPTLAGIDPARARAAIAHREGWLPPSAVREVLAAYGVRTPKSATARTAKEAAAQAAAMGFPVAVKLDSQTITHKSDVGGVILNIEGADAAGAAFDAIHDRLARLGKAAAMSGVVVQEMVPPGVQTLVGLSRTPAFGALIGFGIGGVEVEVWKDIVFRVAPITDLDASDMLAHIRGAKLLDGYRGSPAADREALVDTLLRVSRMATDLPEIMEMDINPLLALAPGRGAVAVDARLRVQP